MIPIPEVIKLKLVELDQKLHLLGRQLYGKKLFGNYEDQREFQNFLLELHFDGSFTLRFQRQILGSIEQRTFGETAKEQSDVVSELDMLLAVTEQQLQLVSV